jgi:hypothetical protein
LGFLAFFGFFVCLWLFVVDFILLFSLFSVGRGEQEMLLWVFWRFLGFLFVFGCLWWILFFP